MTRQHKRPGSLAAVACASIAALLSTGCGGARPRTHPQTPRSSTAIARTTDAAAVARLRSDIDGIVDAPALRAGTWGIVVRSLVSGEVLYSRNPRTLLTPASGLKVITLAVAAEQLGWDFTYQTEVLGLGAIDFGFLDGDLIVRGSGDPSLMAEPDSGPPVFRLWAERLLTLGVRSLSGRIIGDDNAFDDEGHGAGWMWDDMDQAYSAGVGALQLNVDATILTVTPANREGTDATVALGTMASGLTVRNHVVTGAAGTPTQVTVRRIANSPVLDVTGSIAVGAEPVRRRIAVDNPTRYFVEEMRQALMTHGIDVKGAAVDIDDLPAPPAIGDAVPLLVHRSPPLSSLAETMMRVSQNQYAETLLKTLGARAGSPTFDGGRRVIQQVLASWGIEAGQVAQADGSGLSRYNLVTADAMTAVLAHVAGSPVLNGPFRDSLPIAGRPGALSDRLAGTAAAGTIQAKTGSMRNARSISGFARTADDEPVAFSVIVNNYGVPGSDVERAADALLLTITAFRR